MNKIYCIRCINYGKFKNTKISHIFYKTLVLYVFCDELGSKDETIFNKEESIQILKILGLINDMQEYQTNL